MKARMEMEYKREIQKEEQDTARKEKIEAEYAELFAELEHIENNSNLYPEKSQLVIREQKETLSRMYARDTDPDRLGELEYNRQMDQIEPDSDEDRRLLDRVYGRKLPDIENREGRE